VVYKENALKSLPSREETLRLGKNQSRNENKSTIYKRKFTVVLWEFTPLKLISHPQ
jgi:hypothetical protein